jgi:hypothetical protein
MLENLNEKQKEDLKEIFKGMKLSMKESERVTGGAMAWICIGSGCNAACNTSCTTCVACPTNGYACGGTDAVACTGLATYCRNSSMTVYSSTTGGSQS